MNDQLIKHDQRKTILILGINSFIGSSVAEFLKKDFRVVGTYYRRHVTQKGILTLPCNVLNKEEVQLVMYAFKPDFILYCVGLPSIKACAESPNSCDALNSGGLYNVAEMAPRYGARVIYLSSHYVFAGDNKNYNEMDNPDVLTQYGKALASAEFYLQKSSLNYLIFRCCRIYGRGVNPLKYTFFEQMQKNMRDGQNAVYDDSSFQGFIDVYYLAMLLKICMDKNISNRLLHFSSQDITTHFEFAKMYCEIFNESEGLVSKGKWPVQYLKGSHAPDISYFKLDVLNMEGLLKIKLPTVRESLEFTYQRYHGEKKISKQINTKGEGISFI